MIAYYVNRWMIFYWLHGLLNRLTGGRRLRWVFEGPNGAVVRSALLVDWGHTDAEVLWWHREQVRPFVTPNGRWEAGWRMLECPREIDPAYNSAGAVLTAPPGPEELTPASVTTSEAVNHPNNPSES